MDLKKTNAPVNTITYDKSAIEAPTGNVYEAITIIAKRANQINSEIKKELIETFEIGWKANVKARIHSADLLNRYRKRGDEKPFRAQQEMYNYYQNKLDVIAEELQ